MQGKVRFFEPLRFYGFIDTACGSWFFHGSDVIGAKPTAGDKVSFRLDDGERGTDVAVEVTVVQSRRVRPIQ